MRFLADGTLGNSSDFDSECRQNVGLGPTSTDFVDLIIILTQLGRDKVALQC